MHLIEPLTVSLGFQLTGVGRAEDAPARSRPALHPPRGSTVLVWFVWFRLAAALVVALTVSPQSESPLCQSVLWLGLIAIELLLRLVFDALVHLLLAILVLLVAEAEPIAFSRTRPGAQKHTRRGEKISWTAGGGERGTRDGGQGGGFKTRGTRTSSSGSSSSSATVASSLAAVGLDRPSRPTTGKSKLNLRITSS
jgi:uncharacterized membrane protein YgcG